MCRIEQSALLLFTLNNRKQYVKVNDVVNKVRNVINKLPQGTSLITLALFSIQMRRIFSLPLCL